MAFVIADAGPLVALLDVGQEDHSWAVEQSRALPQPIFTCDAVLTEAFFLISRKELPGRHLRQLLRSGKIVSDFDLKKSLSRVLELMEIYRNLPMSFADACLVSMIEQNPGALLFTLDRDFTIYRQHRRRIIPLIAPF